MKKVKENVMQVHAKTIMDKPWQFLKGTNFLRCNNNGHVKDTHDVQGCKIMLSIVTC
jgi:hypothetical protein